jgi:hypothetical protein
VGTACQRPGAKRSRRRPAFFAGRSLTGRDPRARTLFPLRNGSVPVAAKSTADALPVRSCECFSDSLRDCRTPFTVTKTAHCPGRIPSRTLLGVCRESSPSGLRPLPDRRRTKPGRTPDSSTRGGNGPDSASTRNPRRINTFTRRAPYSARREPISSRRPATALFSVVTNKLPKVAVQLPIGDDVSTSSPCEAWPGFDFQRFHAASRRNRHLGHRAP